MTIARFLPWVFSTALVACGDSSATTDGGGGSGASSGTDAASSSAATMSTGTGTTNYDGYGSTYAFSYDLMGAMGITHASGASAGYARASATPQVQCTTEKDDPCTFSDCKSIPTGTPPEYFSAGPITITGGTHVITLMPKADKTYTNDSQMISLFAGGETLTFDVAGAGEIPAHSTMVTAPGPITVTAPPFGPGLTIDRSQDLTVTWTGGVAGTTVNVTVGSYDMQAGGSRIVAVGCGFDAVAGTGTITSSHLTKLLATGGTVTGTATVVPSGLGSVTAGSWSAAFTVAATASTPAGGTASSAATIQ